MPAPPAPADEADPDERRRVRLTIALLGFAAGVQLAGMLGRGVLAPTDLVMHSIVALPAAGFAIALWRGLRMRIGIIAFALLWSAFSIWAVIVLTRFTRDAARHAAGPGGEARLTVVLAHRRRPLDLLHRGRDRPRHGPSPPRRRVAGAVLGALFAVLFVIEHGYQIFR